MNVPQWYAVVLLTLASFRTWKLLADDDIMDRARRWVTRLGKWDAGPFPDDYRQKLAEFINCPWCFGFWISLAWWGAWQWLPHATLVAASVFAISAVVGLIARASAE
jgi:hypothetical protein